MLRPVALFRDPFRKDPHKVVMCECYTPDGKPALHNNRAAAVAPFEKVKDQKPWFGMEQEYSLVTRFKRPLGWPTGGYPGPQGPYYCGNGIHRVFGRSFVRVEGSVVGAGDVSPALTRTCVLGVFSGGGPLQGVPVRGDPGERRQRRGDAVAVGVPGGSRGGHCHGRPAVDRALDHVPSRRALQDRRDV